MSPADIRYMDDLLIEVIKSIHTLEGLVCTLGLLILGCLVSILANAHHGHQTYKQESESR